MSADELVEATKADDAWRVEQLLRAHPELLKNGSIRMNSVGYSGYPLHVAGFYNASKVIRMLVNKFGVDVNQCEGVSSKWTPLHHAAMQNSCEAIELLLSLGANPYQRNSENDLPSGKTDSPRVKQIFKDAANGDLKKTQQEQKDGLWLLSGQHEVTSHRRLPDNSYRLTDIFNFETRRVVSIVKDLKDGHIAQSIEHFDDIYDKQALYTAHEHLLALGGTIDASIIDRAPLRGKSPLKPHGGLS